VQFLVKVSHTISGLDISVLLPFFIFYFLFVWFGLGSRFVFCVLGGGCCKGERAMGNKKCGGGDNARWGGIRDIKERRFLIEISHHHQQSAISCSNTLSCGLSINLLFSVGKCV
jgi:hypothetical protein